MGDKGCLSCLVVIVGSLAILLIIPSLNTGVEVFCLLGVGTIMMGGFISEIYSEKKEIEEPEQPIELTPDTGADLGWWFRLQLGQPEKWDAQKAKVLMESLLSLAQNVNYVRFSIVAGSEGISFRVDYISPPLKDVGVSNEVFTSTLQSVYPDMEISDHSELGEVSYPHKTAYHIFESSKNHPFFETMTTTEFRHDPLVTLLLAMDQVQQLESLVFSMEITSKISFDESDRQDLLMMSRWDAGDRPKNYYKKDFVQSAIDGFYETTRLKNTPVSIYKAGDERRFEQKLSQPLFLTHMSLRMKTNNMARFAWFKTLSAQVKGLATSHTMIAEGIKGIVEVKNYDEWLEIHRPKIYKMGRDNKHTFALTVDELAGLWHVPHDAMTAKKLDWKVPAPLPDELKNIEGVIVGHSGHDEVRFPRSTTFKTEHIAIIGRTGMGKSSLMLTLIQDDIQQGKGVIVIDPKGDLVNDILKYSIPSERENDVVVLDIYEKLREDRYPPPLNPLASNPDDLSAILNSLYRSDWSNTRASDWLSLALKTLDFFEGATIRDIKRVIQDVPFREKLLHKGMVNNPDPEKRLALNGLREGWKSFDQTGEKQTSLDAMNRRLDTFTTDGQLLALTCNPHDLKLVDLVAQNKIILIALGRDFGKGKPYGKRLKDDELQILGTSLVSQIFGLTMAGRIPRKHRPYTFYVDEAHLFKTANFDEMLALVRSRGLGLVLSTQSLNQLSDRLEEAFEDNMGTLISFQVSAKNTKALSTYMSPPFGADDLSRLNRHQAAVYMKDEKGIQHPAFQMTTNPPPEHQVSDDYPADETEQRIRKKSVDNLGLKTYSEVADLIIGSNETDDLSRFNTKIYDADDEDEDYIYPDDEGE